MIIYHAINREQEKAFDNLDDAELFAGKYGYDEFSDVYESEENDDYLLNHPDN